MLQFSVGTCCFWMDDDVSAPVRGPGSGERILPDALIESFPQDEYETLMEVRVSRGLDIRAFLVVCLPYLRGSGFSAGMLYVPETDLLFVGGGERILAYNLTTRSRLWEDTAETGFWGLSRHGDTVIMMAELEMAAWSLDGEKRWTTFVEPPWNYEVEDDSVVLDVMGTRSRFNLHTGPHRR
jgi:hypothetical protein